MAKGKAKKSSALSRNELKSHPFCDLVPGGMTEDEHTALVEDIKLNGVRQPVTVFQGKVLDGRERVRAALQANVTFATQDFAGTEDEARAYVFSVNLHRRTLNNMQRAFAVAELYKRCVNSDGPKPSQEQLAKRYGVSKSSLSLCIKAVDSRNSMLLTRLKRGEVTRGELEEEFFDPKDANASQPTSSATENEDIFGDVPLPSNVTKFPEGGKGGKAGPLAATGTKPRHPERKASETPASVVCQQFKALGEKDRIAFVEMAWPWLENVVIAHQAIAVAKGSGSKSHSKAAKAKVKKAA